MAACLLLAANGAARAQSYTFTTLAGSGNQGTNDGTGSSAQFNFPEGVAVDSAGNVYVADTGNNTIRKVTPTGVVTTLAGLAGVAEGSADGTNSSARFGDPEGVAVDSVGNVYVADADNDTIRKVTPSITGQQTNWVVTTLAGLAGNSGSADGTGSSARFGDPRGVAVDDAGNLYVADGGNDTIRKVTPSIAGQQTNWVVTTLGGLAGVTGFADGTGSSARFFGPIGVAVDSAGNLYVGDTGNSTIRKGSPLSLINPGIDIGLRAYDGHGIIKIGALPGTPISPLRINKNGTNYSVVLVPTNSTSASRVRIQTSEGTKSLEKLP
jgi:secreted PhoX family phosphatase